MLISAVSEVVGFNPGLGRCQKEDLYVLPNQTNKNFRTVQMKYVGKAPSMRCHIML